MSSNSSDSDSESPSQPIKHGRHPEQWKQNVVKVKRAKGEALLLVSWKGFRVFLKCIMSSNSSDSDSESPSQPIKHGRHPEQWKQNVVKVKRAKGEALLLVSWKGESLSKNNNDYFIITIIIILFLCWFGSQFIIIIIIIIIIISIQFNNSNNNAFINNK